MKFILLISLLGILACEAHVYRSHKQSSNVLFVELFSNVKAFKLKWNIHPWVWLVLASTHNYSLRMYIFRAFKMLSSYWICLSLTKEITFNFFRSQTKILHLNFLLNFTENSFLIKFSWRRRNFPIIQLPVPTFIPLENRRTFQATQKHLAGALASTNKLEWGMSHEHGAIEASSLLFRYVVFSFTEQTT